MQIALISNLLLIGLVFIAWGVYGEKVKYEPVTMTDPAKTKSNAGSSSPLSADATPRVANLLVMTPFSPSSTRERYLTSPGVVQEPGYPGPSEDSPRFSLAPTPDSPIENHIHVEPY